MEKFLTEVSALSVFSGDNEIPEVFLPKKWRNAGEHGKMNFFPSRIIIHLSK